MFRRFARTMMLTACVAGFSLSAQAQEWGDIVTMGAITSNTMGRRCSGIPGGFGRYFNIECASTAPSITTAGDVSVTGNLSAAQFIGDGSLLTGVTSGAADRITSGTSSVIATSATSSISFTTAGTQRMTILSNGNVGVGTSIPTVAFEVNGPIKSKKTTGQSYLMASGNSGSYPGVYIALNSDTYSRVGFEMNASDQGSIFFGPGGATNKDLTLFRPSPGKLYLGTGTPGTFNGTLVAGQVGIGTTTPSVALEVSGTVSATLVQVAGTGNEGCTTATRGTIRYNPTLGSFQSCR